MALFHSVASHVDILWSPHFVLCASISYLPLRRPHQAESNLRASLQIQECLAQFSPLKYLLH